MEYHTLSIITRLDEDIVHDSQFDTEDYLIKHFAKSFGKAEENAFINGTGVNMPIGILNGTDGAEVGVITNEITFDDVIALYFSLKSEYRTKGSWLINDEIAKQEAINLHNQMQRFRFLPLYQLQEDLPKLPFDQIHQIKFC